MSAEKYKVLILRVTDHTDDETMDDLIIRIRALLTDNGIKSVTAISRNYHVNHKMVTVEEVEDPEGYKARKAKRRTGQPLGPSINAKPAAPPSFDDLTKQADVVLADDSQERVKAAARLNTIIAKALATYPDAYDPGQRDLLESIKRRLTSHAMGVDEEVVAESIAIKEG